MKLLMISMQESVERRATARQAFAAEGLTIEFLDGINGSKATAPLFESYDEKHYLLSSGRPPSAGEQGCYASHVEAWKQCVQLNEPIVILEDDAKPETGLASLLPALPTLTEQFGFIRLEPLEGRPHTLVKTIEHHQLVYCRKFPHCLTGYAISPAVAKVFIEKSRALTAPADKFVKEFWIHGQPLYCIIPAVIDKGSHALNSNISGRDKFAKPPLLAVRRSLYKAGSAIRRALFNLKHTPKPH